jgi:hypothetical protein
MVLNQIEEVQAEDIASENEEDEEEMQEVLGISDKVLPKTGKRAYGLVVLLVVDVLLWYSVYILRRNYESKNTNSRVRTKSK